MRLPVQKTVGTTTECPIQVMAEDIHQQGVQREYHLYNYADSPLHRTARQGELPQFIDEQ